MIGDRVVLSGTGEFAGTDLDGLPHGRAVALHICSSARNRRMGVLAFAKNVFSLGEKWKGGDWAKEWGKIENTWGYLRDCAITS